MRFIHQFFIVMSIAMAGCFFSNPSNDDDDGDENPGWNDNGGNPSGNSWGDGSGGGSTGNSASTTGDGSGTTGGGGGTTGGSTDTECTTTLDVYAANVFYPSVVRLAFHLFCGDTNIGNKTATDFTIFEDGDPISAFESELTMVPITASFQLTTALVLDMSGSMIESGRLPQLIGAVNTFINRTESEQSIGIYLFDGRENLTTLQPFTTNKDILLASVDTLYDYEAVDPSTNLNGAIVRGLALLDAEEIEADRDGVTFGGTLAVFTDGTDQAGRVSDASAVAAVEASSHAVYSVGLGGEVDSAHLEDVGKSGTLLASDVDELSDAFEDLAQSIRAQTAGYYVIAYCSPKRAGDHTLEIRLTGTSAKAGVNFNADGFDSGCDPSDFISSE